MLESTQERFLAIDMQREMIDGVLSYMLSTQFVILIPSLMHSSGCSPFSLLHIKNDALYLAHSLPIILAAATSSMERAMEGQNNVSFVPPGTFSSPISPLPNFESELKKLGCASPCTWAGGIWTRARRDHPAREGNRCNRLIIESNEGTPIGNCPHLCACCCEQLAFIA